MMQITSALGFLGLFAASASAATNPIVVKGAYMYDSVTKERFFVKGLTYEYAVDDTNYAKWKDRLDKVIALGVNSLRLYNINPDLSYDKFMTDMAAAGVYVMPAATPGGDPYFDNYKYCTLNRFSPPDEKVPNNCYPACLLQYGKKVAANFAKYDNTLALIIGNEVMQYNATSAPCVKQYASDLKAWMGSADGVKAMRTLPLAYAEADSAPEPAIVINPKADANEWATLRNQFFVCDDKYVNGVGQSSLDITMVNTYRWCDDLSGPTGYDNINKAMKGFPGAVLFGEFDCAKGGQRKLDSAVKYLFSSKMTEVFSGGFAYTWGTAGVAPALAGDGYQLVTDSDSDIAGDPGSATNDNYDKLKAAYTAVKPTSTPGTWSSKSDLCTKFSGTVPAGEDFKATCKTVVSEMSTKTNSKVSWPIKTRENAGCNDQGEPCPVAYPKGLKTTQSTLCGGSAPTLAPSKASGGGNGGNDSDAGSNNEGTGNNSAAAGIPYSWGSLAVAQAVVLLLWQYA